MTTTNLNESLLAALKTLVDEVEMSTYQFRDRMLSGRLNGRVCSATALENAKAAIEAAEKETQ